MTFGTMLNFIFIMPPTHPTELQMTKFDFIMLGIQTKFEVIKKIRLRLGVGWVEKCEDSFILSYIYFCLEIKIRRFEGENKGYV